MIKKNKGITLIALVITIIVLLILAGVSLSLTLGDDGLIAQAQRAREEAEGKDEWEQVELAVVSARNASLNGADFEVELKKNIKREFESENVTKGEKEDEYVITLNNGNIYRIMGEEVAKVEMGLIDNVKIPEGFHHVTGNTREEGIVVADRLGNEYVWIPVTKNEDGTATKPYEGTNGKLSTSKGEVDIMLQRNNFGDHYTNLTTQYTEDTRANHDSQYSNAVAENIEGFKESVKEKGGYFLGRYEAGIKGGTLEGKPPTTAPDKNYTYWKEGQLVVKKEQQAWNYITQNKASELCRNIDSQNNYIELTSDLTNSYALDTAIVYIEKCGGAENSANYSKEVGRAKNQENEFKTGMVILKKTDALDIQCNIYDIAGNCREWITETYRNLNAPCVTRGGYCWHDDYTAGSRKEYPANANFVQFSFRPILYWSNVK